MKPKDDSELHNPLLIFFKVIQTPFSCKYGGVSYGF